MKIAYIRKVRNVLAVAIVGVLFGSAYIANPSFLSTLNVQAAATDNVSGFAWSETIGWISFNNLNAPATATSYGVNISPLTGAGIFSGYAWSENIGWISFNSTDTATCPVAPCQASVNWSTGKVTGWARALAGIAGGGWDGWIKLSDDAVAGWTNNGVKISLTTGAFSGYAWGSDVVGWIDFAPATALANVVHGPIPIATIYSCPNGATNSPSCTQCPSNQAYYLSTCVNCTNGGCTGGGGSASNPTGTLTCTNGATNPLFCNSCPASQTLVGSSCVNNCTNGATNPSACTACTAPQTLVAGVCTSPATTCGNGTCEAGETLMNCPTDCHATVTTF